LKQREAAIRTAAAAGLLSALLLWMSAPPIGAGWLAWFALVPVALVVLRAPGAMSGRLAVPLAYAAYLELLLVPALPFGLAEGQWGDPAIPVLIGDSPVLAVALVAIPLVAVGLWAIRFGEPWGASRLRAGPAVIAVIAVPALAWTALDFARVNLDPGGLWGPLFLSQAGEPTAALAGLAGPWALTLAIVAVNYGLALALVRRRLLPALVPVALTLAAVTVASWTSEPATSGPRIGVAAIQPGYDTAEEDRWVLRRFERGTWDLAALDLVQDLGQLTRRAVGAGAEVVVWPEASMYVDPRERPRVRRALRHVATDTGATLVVPFFLPGPGKGATLAVVPLRGGARLTGARPKQRPMWWLGEHSDASGEPEPLLAGGLAIGTLLGVDSQGSRVAARLAGGGAELLVSGTHDWRQSAVQHRAFEQLAARAAAVPLVRADWRYGSAIYDERGRVLADAGEGLGRTSVVATVGAASASTPYASLGDLVGWVAVAMVGLAALLGLRQRAPPATSADGPMATDLP
jgi:apolipoprotein N-acyltransferase